MIIVSNDRSRRPAAGFAVLESALIVTVLFTFGLTVLGILDHLNRIDHTYSVLDRELHNSDIKGSLIEGVGESGGYRLVVNEPAIRAFVDQSVDRFVGSGVEVGYAIADFDQRTGELLGVGPVLHRALAGTGRPPSSDKCPGLDAELLNFSSSLSQNVPSVLAVPDGSLANPGFLPHAVLVGARVEVDHSQATLTRQVLEMIGSNPRTVLCSASALRGDVSGN